MICFICRLHFLQVRLVDQLIKLGNAGFDLRRHIFQQSLSFCGDGIDALQRFMDASVDLRKLLVGEKPVSLDQTGADREVLLCRLVVIIIVVALPQAGSPITPLPGDKLDAVPGGMPCEYGAIEVCQQFIVFA